MTLSLIALLIIIALVSWIVANGCSLLINRVNEHYYYGHNGGLIWLSAILPLIFPALLLLSVLFIFYGKSVGWLDDHCLNHDPHHPHFCIAHFQSVALSSLNSILLIGFFACFISIVVYKIIQLIFNISRTNIIANLSKSNYLVARFDHKDPIAFTFGVINPKIYLSNAIKKLLTKREQRIVLAHETAHVRNNDTMKSAILECLLSMHLYPKSIRRNFYLKIESRADRNVISRFHSLDVAQLLIKLGRFNIKQQQPISIIGSQLEHRISLLLYPSAKTKSAVAISLSLMALVFTIPVGVMYNHHTLETLIGWLI